MFNFIEKLDLILRENGYYIHGIALFKDNTFRIDFINNESEETIKTANELIEIAINNKSIYEEEYNNKIQVEPDKVQSLVSLLIEKGILSKSDIENL